MSEELTIRDYITAGHSVFTIQSLRTETRSYVRVSQKNARRPFLSRKDKPMNAKQFKNDNGSGIIFRSK